MTKLDELDKILYSKNPVGVINIKIAKEELHKWCDTAVRDAQDTIRRQLLAEAQDYNWSKKDSPVMAVPIDAINRILNTKEEK